VPSGAVLSRRDVSGWVGVGGWAMQCQHMTTVLEHVGATHAEKLARGGGAPHSSANGAVAHGATVVSVNGVVLPRGQRIVLNAGDNLVFSSPNPRSRPISFVRTLPSPERFARCQILVTVVARGVAGTACEIAGMSWALSSSVASLVSGYELYPSSTRRRPCEAQLHPSLAGPSWAPAGALLNRQQHRPVFTPSRNAGRLPQARYLPGAALYHVLPHSAFPSV
jgi:hypothetical protein